MKQMGLRKLAIATATVAVATLSLSVDSAQARRLYVAPYSVSPYRADLTGLPWYAVRAYYAGGPWCAVGAGWGTGWAGSWTCYSGWPDYAQRNGIGCAPGSIVKGGDGINYVCQ
jgi:hypothetical protein